MRDLRYERQVELPILYKDVTVSCGYRSDAIVEGVVLMELKAVERILAVHEAQLLTYLRLSAIRVGLLLNFNVSAMKNGIVRKGPLILNLSVSPWCIPLLLWECARSGSPPDPPAAQRGSPAANSGRLAQPTRWAITAARSRPGGPPTSGW